MSVDGMSCVSQPDFLDDANHKSEVSAVQREAESAGWSKSDMEKYKRLMGDSDEAGLSPEGGRDHLPCDPCALIGKSCMSRLVVWGFELCSVGANSAMAFCLDTEMSLFCVRGLLIHAVHMQWHEQREYRVIHCCSHRHD